MRDEEHMASQPPKGHARQKIQMDMVNILQMSPTFTSEAGRHLALQMVAETLGRPPTVRSHAVERTQLIDIVYACAKSQDGLHALIEAAVRLEPETREVIALQQLLDEWQVAPLFFEDDWSAFRTALGDLVLPELVDLFRAATRSRLPRPPNHCKTAWQVFVYLAGSSAGNDGVPPYMIFLDQVSGLLPPHVGQELRVRNHRRASELGLTAALNAVPLRRTDPVNPHGLSSYLVIQLEPDGLDPDRYTLSHWYQWDVTAWHPQRGEDRIVQRLDLEDEVEHLINDMESDWSDSLDTVTVEFVLPWELINAPVDWWHKESSSDRPTPLAMDYPVVVRSLERLRTRRWHRAWRARWQRLKHRPSLRTYWSRPTGEDYCTALETELKSDGEIASLILSQPPDSEGGRQEVEAALRAGLPVIVWHRSDCGGVQFREEISELMANGGLADMPIRARELRRKAMRPPIRDDHIGRHLTVLWDDPERQPEMSRSSGAPEEGPTDGSGTVGWRQGHGS
jgi:hypothetical protein